MADFVDMDSKTCIFGYGAIKISIFGQKILFEGITPVGAGTAILNQTGPTTLKIGKWEFTGSKLHITFDTVSEIRQFCEKLKYIEKSQGGIFTFKGITFDFNTYSQDSIDLVKAAVKWAKYAVYLVYLMTAV